MLTSQQLYKVKLKTPISDETSFPELYFTGDRLAGLNKAQNSFILSPYEDLYLLQAEGGSVSYMYYQANNRKS